MIRLPPDFEPSYPWLWMAVLSKPASNGLGAAVSAAAVVKSATSVLSGDLSSILMSGISSLGGDTAFSALIQAVTLPARGFSIKYNNLGFVQYPEIDKILTEPIQVDFIENETCDVAKYLNAWLRDIAPTTVSVGRRADVAESARRSSEFAVLADDSVTRSLYVIKMRRDLALALVNGVLTSLNREVLAGFAQLRSGISELPVQIYCFPKVFPEKVTEDKLDKSETNSTRKISVVLNRVPRLVVPTADSIGSGAFVASKEEMLMTAVMGASAAVGQLSSALMGVVNTVGGAVTGAQRLSGFVRKSDARGLTDLSAQPEPGTE